MELDEIAKEGTIEFPRPISREDAENLFCYIAKELPASISSHIDYYKSFSYNEERDKVLEDEGTLIVIASVSSLKKERGYDTFVSKPGDRDTSCISAIASQTVPGWELLDYRPEVRKLWKDVREVVNRYFGEDLKTKADDETELNIENSKK